MKRAGFTMIELIFVIVILGILAAVALPKFAGVSDQANAQKCNAFVGTLNRTVGPSMWSASIANDLGGNITTFKKNDGLFEDPTTYLAIQDVPYECLGTAVGPAASGTAYIGPIATPLGNRTFGVSSYYLNQTSLGTLSDSARWTWEKYK